VRRDVEFEGQGGVRLRGWFYRPSSAGVGRQQAAVPGIVMVHGLSALKEMALDRFAEVFCEAGMAVLVYDHRCFGESDGEPRQIINPWAQARDFRHAIGWLARQPEVDPDRIGIWGSSYGGGEAIVVAACDERVKAAVANVPFAGYPDTDYHDTAPHCAAIREQLDDESGASLADIAQSSFGPVAVICEPASEAPVLLNQSESTEWFGQWESRAPRWVNSVTLENAAGTEPAWDPGACIAHVAPRALLLVVATDDRLAETSIARAAFERAGQPKECVLLEGHHFVAYEGEGFVRASEAARDFFERHLKAS